MRKLVLVVALMVLLICAGCNSLMHRTIAEQAVRLDKNCITLLTQYRALLLHAEFPIDPDHEIALLDATLLLSADIRKSAEVALGE